MYPIQQYTSRNKVCTKLYTHSKPCVRDMYLLTVLWVLFDHVRLSAWCKLNSALLPQLITWQQKHSKVNLNVCTASIQYTQLLYPTLSVHHVYTCSADWSLQPQHTVQWTKTTLYYIWHSRIHTSALMNHPASQPATTTSNLSACARVRKASHQ